MRKTIAAAVAAIGMASSAQAVSYFSLAANAADPGLASFESVLTGFDGGDAVGYSDASNFAITSGTGDGAVAPAGDSSKYGAVGAGGSVMLDMRNAFSSRFTAARSVSVYLGSIEADDYIQVLGLAVGGSLDLTTPLMTITGAQLLASLTAPDQRLYINFAAGEQVSALVFGATSSMFEFDTLAVSSAVYAIGAGQTTAPGNKRPAATLDNASPGQANYMLSSNGAPAGAPGVPEPASWAMMISGFLMIGGMLRARRSQAAFAI